MFYILDQHSKINFVLNEKLTTEYGYISGIYFRKILKTIISVGQLEKTNKIILDFGCGYGELKKLLNNTEKIINFDIKPKFSEILSWEDVDFDILVANQVFYTFKEEELETLLLKLRNHNPNLTIIVGISNQGILNKIGAKLLLNFKAHLGTILDINKEIQVFNKYCVLMKTSSVFGLTSIFIYKFKKYN